MPEYVILLQKLHNVIPKYRAFLPNGKTILFGDSRYEDYTQHKNDERKRLYIDRHASREDWSDIETKGFWSRWLLWNKKTINESLNDIERRFGVVIIPL